MRALRNPASTDFRRHFRLAYVSLGLTAALVVAGTSFAVILLRGEEHPTCSERIPSVAPGAKRHEAAEAAFETTAIFVRTTVMRNKAVRASRSYGEPVCGWYLVTEQIKNADPTEDEPEEWVDGEIPVSPYPTLQPVKADVRLAPRSRELIVQNRRGVDEMAGWIFLDAPDLPPALFQIVLELHRGRWLVAYWGSTFALTRPPRSIELQ